MDVIERSKGVNRSEELLAQLCDRAFLPLWCYPNLFRQKGKELADILVVFGDDVVLFSDKAHAFPDTGNLELDWQRWKSRSIDDSIRQLRRAEAWLRRYPAEVYLDPKCAVRFPLTINPKGRFHRVLVARNAKERCSKHLTGSGSLMICAPGVPAPPQPEPFRVYLSEHGDFVHVFDDVTLPIVLRELDTAADFLDYLTKKERAFSLGHILSCAGEEEALAVFCVSILHWARETQERAFPATTPSEPLIIIEGHWEALKKSKHYEEKKRADEISYLWDAIIHTFGRGLQRGEAPNPDGLSFSTLERIGRYLASESRLYRRTLAAVMVDARLRTVEGEALNRTILSEHRRGLAYVFSFLPNVADSEAEYRQFRREYAGLYASHTLMRFPQVEEVLVIATESEHVEHISFDFALVPRQIFPTEFQAIVAEAAEEYGWIREPNGLEWRRVWSAEYPGMLINPGRDPKPNVQRREKQNRRMRRKAQRAARKRNRGRA